MNRLMKKIALKEGVDCRFNVIGDCENGEIFLVLNEKLKTKHTYQWKPEYTKQENIDDETIAYYTWGTKQHDNPFYFMPEEPDTLLGISGAIEIIEEYRYKNNKEDSDFNNVFEVLMKKLQEVCFNPLIRKYGAGNVFYFGYFINFKLFQRYIDELKEKYGMDIYINIFKEKMKKYFNRDLDGENLRLIDNMMEVLQSIKYATNIGEDIVKLILGDNRFSNNDAYILLDYAYSNYNGFSEQQIELLKNGGTLEEIVPRNKYRY